MKNTIYIYLLILATACNSHGHPSENLLVNGSAELGRYDSIPPGWTSVQGPWHMLEGDSEHHDYGFAQEGKYFFFAGQDTLGILQQDVDVSKYATGIDAHKQLFTFHGFAQSLDQGPNSDQAMLTIQGLDSSKGKTVYSFSTDTTRSIAKWLPLSDSFVAPVSTRFIRVQLIAIRHVGGDNDGYFDNLILTTSSAGNQLSRNLLIIGAIALLFIVVLVIVYRNRSARKNQPTKNINTVKS